MSLKDTGLRPVEVCRIKLKDYRTAKKNSPVENIAVFKPVTNNKTGVVMAVHLGFEAIEAIDAYLEDEALNEFTQRLIMII